MSRYKRVARRLRKKDESYMIDIPYTSMLLFLITTVLAMIWMKTSDNTSVPEYEALKVTVTWDTCLDERSGDRRYPGLSEADVDLHVLGVMETPNGTVRDRIGFNVPDRKTQFFILNQDDKGYSGLQLADPNGDIIREENKEIITSNLEKLPDGKYFVNLHLYHDDGELRRAGKVCNDVEVVIYKGHKNKEKVICDLNAAKRTSVNLTQMYQEKTACMFQISDGKFVEGSNEEVIDYPFVTYGRPSPPRD